MDSGTAVSTEAHTDRSPTWEPSSSSRASSATTPDLHIEDVSVRESTTDALFTPNSSQLIRLENRVERAVRDMESVQIESDALQKRLREFGLEASQVAELQRLTNGNLQLLFDSRGLKRSIQVLDKNGRIHRAIHIVDKWIEAVPGGHILIAAGRFIIEVTDLTFDDPSPDLSNKGRTSCFGLTVEDMLDGEAISPQATTPAPARTLAKAARNRCCF